MTDPRRALPSVGTLLESQATQALLATTPRPLVADAVRLAVAEAREAPDEAPASDHEWAARIASILASKTRRSLRPVLNATGVVLHTNLGRAPLATEALQAVEAIASGYSTLEFDLERGDRGSRSTHCAALLTELTGAEDALAVNNGAAALLLALDTFARGRDAIISRGELIEIGGSFRVPDIMATSGARLLEIGTTNRTHLDDYRRALSPETGAIVKVHRSNFAVHGFVASVEPRMLASVAAEAGVPLVHDLGSGQLLSLESLGLRGEPLASEAVRDGATIITMSGDKLLGGPQAGIILGRREAVARMRKNPLARALRVDKMTLAALEATLSICRDPARAMREIPTLAMLAAPVDALRERAQHIVRQVGGTPSRARVIETEAQVGGGSFPDATLRSVAIVIDGEAERLAATLRQGNPPVVGRIQDQSLVLDLRTILPPDDERLTAALLLALR